MDEYGYSFILMVKGMSSLVNSIILKKRNIREQSETLEQQIEKAQEKLIATLAFDPVVLPHDTVRDIAAAALSGNGNQASGFPDLRYFRFPVLQ